MSRPKSAKPGYCLHKSSGRAYVTIDNQTTYLGPYGCPESRDRYDQLIGEWIARGRPRAVPAAGPLTVAQLILAFMSHAETLYPAPPFEKGRRPQGELGNYWDAVRPLRRLYGRTPAAEFGPLALESVQEEMIRLGWCRNVINRRVNRLKHVFKWAVSKQRIPETVYRALATVEGLRRGRSAARESEPVPPVAETHVTAVLDRLSRQVRAMVQLQMLTGMRPGEVCSMRSGEIDTTGSTNWFYTPGHHKTAHHGHERRIPIGPRARQVLEPFLKPDLQAYVFSPSEATAERRAARHAARTTPASCGNTPGSNVRHSPRRAPGACYRAAAYRLAVERACDAAFPPPDHLARQRVPARGRNKKSSRLESAAEWRARLGPERWAELQQWRRDHRWHPNQLRHTFATLTEKEFSIEHAQAVLGHRTPAMTRVYAAGQSAKAEQVVSRIG